MEKWYADRKEVRCWQRQQMVATLDSGYSTSLIGRRRKIFDPLHDLCGGDVALQRDFVHFVRCAFNLNGDDHDDGVREHVGSSYTKKGRSKGRQRKMSSLWRSFIKEMRKRDTKREISGSNAAVPLNRYMRISINSPVQSSAADIVIKSMLNLWENIELKELGFSLLLQIHDEVILEGPKCNVERAKEIVKECMETPWNGMKRTVIFKADVQHSDNWFDAK